MSLSAGRDSGAAEGPRSAVNTDTSELPDRKRTPVAPAFWALATATSTLMSDASCTAAIAPLTASALAKSAWPSFGSAMTTDPCTPGNNGIGGPNWAPACRRNRVWALGAARGMLAITWDRDAQLGSPAPAWAASFNASSWSACVTHHVAVSSAESWLAANAAMSWVVVQCGNISWSCAAVSRRLKQPHAASTARRFGLSELAPPDPNSGGSRLWASQYAFKRCAVTSLLADAPAPAPAPAPALAPAPLTGSFIVYAAENANGN